MLKRVRIPMRDSEGDIEFTIRPAILTCDYVEMQMLYVRIESGECEFDELASRVHQGITSVEGSDGPISLEAIIDLVGLPGVYALAAEMCVGNRVPPGHLAGVRQLLTIANKAQDYDPRHDPPCECRECAGDIEHDPTCLYRFERPQLCDVLANHDWDLLSECWDQPFYVYQMRSESARAASRGQACIHQESERERERKQQAADIRKKRFGTDNWHDIAKQRGA